MIIWIDGANGVGKSHVAAKLEELLSNRNAEYIESDLYWVELIQNNFLKALNGFEPYNNKYCLETIRTVLEEKFQKHNKMPIISMSLVDKRCQEELLDYFEKKNVDVDTSFKYTVQKPTMHRARVIAEKMLDLFNRKELDEVHIIYTRMENAVEMVAETKQLLPLQPGAFCEVPAGIQLDEIPMLPTPKDVLDCIIPNYVTGFIYGSLVESFCSEQNSRMMAMDGATKSAKEILRNLNIEFNRVRQAAITQEITEVISGAKAQKKKKAK